MTRTRLDFQIQDVCPYLLYRRQSDFTKSTGYFVTLNCNIDSAVPCVAIASFQLYRTFAKNI